MRFVLVLLVVTNRIASAIVAVVTAVVTTFVTTKWNTIQAPHNFLEVRVRCQRVSYVLAGSGLDAGPQGVSLWGRTPRGAAATAVALIRLAAHRFMHHCCLKLSS